MSINKIYELYITSVKTFRVTLSLVVEHINIINIIQSVYVAQCPVLSPWQTRSVEHRLNLCRKQTVPCKQMFDIIYIYVDSSW